MERNLPYYAEQQKRKLQNLYEGAWLYGQYVLMAIGTGLGGSSKNPYPEKPVDLYQEAETDDVKIITASERFRASLMEDNVKRYGIASLNPQELEKEVN